MRRNTKSFIKFGVLCFVVVCITIVMYRTFQVMTESSVLNNFEDHGMFARDNPIDEDRPRRFISYFAGDKRYKNLTKIDWHDYRYIDMEKNRHGIGEQGKPEKTDESEQAAVDKLFRKNGFNAYLSDKISVNRSVPDIRHKDCQKKTYYAELPTVSVVVPFYNEYWTTLLRTIYSVLNRSPDKLIADIILVDDHSTFEFLKSKLDQYIAKNLPKVKLVRLPKREGLIAARVAGARKATGDVLIFLDSHTEANVNWLPPLLEPIASDYRHCVCPFIDVIQHTSFEYRAQDEGARGAFDWFFMYKRIVLPPDYYKNTPTEIFESPVMAGGLFAISSKFFWELGGYDEGLDIWGGEQYELSFKIWQCGGKMYDAPCSRVGHIYRGPRDHEKAREGDFLTKNFKRVAEVWMDEYKQYIYDRQPDRYKNVHPGDLTNQLAIREKLQCKPFKWFIENVAYDLVEKYPPVEPPDYASGAIQSVGFPNLCVDTLGHGLQNEIGLYSCAPNKINPQKNQYFSLSWAQDIRIKFDHICWDVSENVKNSRVMLYNCHGSQGNQLWRYDRKNKWLMQGLYKNRCLEADGNNNMVYVNACNDNNINMRWEWAVVNNTALDIYDKSH